MLVTLAGSVSPNQELLHSLCQVRASLTAPSASSAHPGVPRSRLADRPHVNAQAQLFCLPNVPCFFCALLISFHLSKISPLHRVSSSRLPAPSLPLTNFCCPSGLGFDVSPSDNFADGRRARASPPICFCSALDFPSIGAYKSPSSLPIFWCGPGISLPPFAPFDVASDHQQH